MVSDRKIKELRRKQFFNFLADFFDKFDAGVMKDKVGPDFKFTEEERERWLKKYFMKYFMEDMKIEPPVKQKPDDDKNDSGCDHPKTGKPTDAEKKAEEAATREMKDAQLGFSKGLKSKWNPTKLNDDLDDILDRRHRKIERK